MFIEGVIMQVRCIDNTLQRDVLTVGQVYDVIKVNERDDCYELSGLGCFSRSRFQKVTTNLREEVSTYEPQ